MQSILKHTILLIAILLWSCVSVFAGEVRITHFLRDSYASGERTVKSSGENTAMFVNAEFAGGMTNTAKFSLYVSPYLVANISQANVHAYAVRTDYQFTLGTWSERRFDFPNNAPQIKMIDGAAFTPKGAAHPVQNGNTPIGVYSGFMNFRPSK